MSFYIDYIFVVWDVLFEVFECKLVLFVKVYLGLSDVEICKVDVFICKIMVESFGFVCSVILMLVFEFGFEGIVCSVCYKSGIVVWFLCMLCWCYDKLVVEVDIL